MKKVSENISFFSVCDVFSTSVASAGAWGPEGIGAVDRRNVAVTCQQEAGGGGGGLVSEAVVGRQVGQAVLY